MNRQGLYVPLPYPDESLHSLVGRFTVHLNVRGAKVALDLLFDRRTVVASTDLQGHLGRLRWLFEDRWGWTLRRAAWDLTLLPYYTAYRTAVERERAVAALVRDGASNLHTRLGICATTVPVPSALRQCPHCVEQDLARYGETYWHRSHQLPGVLLCPEHGTPLVSSGVPARVRGRHEFLPARAELPSSPILGLASRDLAIAADIARRSAALLAVPFHGPETGKRREQLDRLAALGYDSRRGSLTRLQRDFVDYLGESLLALLEPAWAAQGALPWLQAIRRQRRRALHPLRHVLLDSFIDHRIARGDAPRSPGFGPGPWPCLNWVAPHYRQPVIHDKHTLPSKDGRPSARFACDCGFVFTRRPDDTERPRQVVRFGPLFEREARRLHEGGRTVSGVAWALDVDWKTAKRLLDAPSVSSGQSGGPSERARQGCADQAAWERLIVRYPDDGVTALRTREPALYARLYRYCREWLRTHSPAGSRSATATRPPFDWPARDRALAERLPEAAAQILARNPPQRVTVGRIGKDLGCTALLQKKLHLLPQTAACLEALCETRYQYRLRRLRCATARLGPSAPQWRVLRAAGIRAAYADPELLAAAGLGQVRGGRGSQS